MMRFLTAKDEKVPYANCAKCPLYGQPIVDSFGNPDAKIIFVGEAPGATEVQRGEPFVGRAGQLLNRALQEVGLKREDCYFTNACLCRPEENATPKKPAVDACRPRLYEELKEHKPTVIVPLGAVALRSVAKKMSINQWHGAVEYSEDLKATVVPTYHPAAILRNLRLYPVFLTDLQKAVDVLNGTYKTPSTVTDVSYTVITNTEMFTSWVQKLKEQHEVALDIETASDGKLLCIGLSWEAGHSYIIPSDLLEDKHVLNELNEAFKATNLVGHNLKFDIQGLWSSGLTNAKTRADTMLEHYLLNETPGTHGLKQLAREFLNAPEYDNPVKPFYKKGFENCAPEVLYQYNASDATYTYQLHKLLQSKLSDKQKNLLNTILIPASNVLARMEYTGAYVDTNLLNTFLQKFSQSIAIMHERMKTILGRDFNPNSTKELVKILYDELDLPIPFKKSTDEEHLKMLRPYSKFVSYLLAYRKLKKLESTYARGLLNAKDNENRVHTNFNLHGTVSGRLSSSNPVNL